MDSDGSSIGQTDVSSVSKFLICTIANRLGEYGAMKASFVSNGFNDETCVYRLFDNSAANMWDPYTVISSVLAETDATLPPYVIFCHQDVVLNQGHGLSDLVQALDELELIDPKWAVAGNAGISEALTRTVRIDGPTGRDFEGTTPARVLTLDENLLIVKRSAQLRCSDEMDGFHLYGTDLCLNALLRGYTSYVIDFRLTHNSGGTVDERFYAIQRRLQTCWNWAFMPGVFIGTPCNTFGISRIPVIRRLLNSGRTMFFATGHPWLNTLLFACNRPFLWMLGRKKRSVSVS